MTLADTLRTDILSGDLPPGTVLLQTDLAERYRTSRIPVRDALQRLAADRLVTVIPGKGAKVVALNREELAEVYDLRILLECDLVLRAAKLATPADHIETELVLRKSDLDAGRPGWRAGDNAFHAALYAPAQRPRQMALVAELRDTCAIHALRYDHLITKTDQWLSNHQAIFDQWRSGHGATAAALLAQHITDARNHLLAQMA